MLWNGDRVGVVIRGRRQLVVGHEEVAPPTPVVGAFDRQPGQELVLHRDAELPVVGPHAPSAQDGRVDGGGIRVGVPEIEVVAAEGGAQVAAGGQIVLLRRIQQVAIDDVVLVAVGPAARRAADARADACDDARSGIVRAIDDVGRRGFDVLAEVHLQRGPALAEHVVGEAEPRRDVVVPRDADCAIEANRLRVELTSRWCRCRRRAPSSMRGRTGRRPAASGGQPSIDPARRARQSPRDRADPSAATGSTDGDGDLVVERVAQLLVVRHASVVDRREVTLVPDLDIVRSSHVRHRRTPRGLQRLVLVEAEVEWIEDAAIRKLRSGRRCPTVRSPESGPSSHPAPPCRIARSRRRIARSPLRADAIADGAEYVACVVLYGKSWYPGNDSGDTVSTPNVRPDPIQSPPACGSRRRPASASIPRSAAGNRART